MEAPGPRLSRFAVIGTVVGILVVMVVQMVCLARANSPTWDEPDHIYSAYMQAARGNFGLNPEHPPLIKYLGALPLLGHEWKLPPMQDRIYRLQEAVGGREFLYLNDADSMTFRVRMATSVITILLALLAFLMAQEMFGSGAGLITLGLLAFDPTLMAHSALMTTDAGGACFLLASVYAFYRYAKQPTVLRLLMTVLAVGLALAAKHSSVLAGPMLVLLAATEVAWPRAADGLSRVRRTWKLTGALASIALVSVLILWASYGFRYAARVDGLPLNPGFDAQMARVPSAFQGNILLEMGKLHLLPESYLYGMAHVLVQSKAFTSYLLGTTYPHPVWFYFPVAIFIKSSLTFLILLAVAKWAVMTGRVKHWREIAYLAVPAGVYMLFAMAGGMNIGVRHILPIYVFLAVMIGGVAWKLVERNRRWIYPVVVLLVFQAVSLARAFPAYVSYANEAAGGPARVHELLSDSSSDWGQQLKSVKAYTDAHAIKDCWFAYFGQGVVDPRSYGIPCKPLITADSLFFDGPHDVPGAIDGPVLMSAGVLSGFEFGPGTLNAYEQFKSLKPVAVIDDGVFVFDGHFEIPLASALSHVQKMGILLAANRAPDALVEAQQAVQLAPQSATVNAAMGKALDANGRAPEATPYYEKALMLAETVEPTFQEGLAKTLKGKGISEKGWDVRSGGKRP